MYKLEYLPEMLQAIGFLHFVNFFLVWCQMLFFSASLIGTDDLFRKLGSATYICSALLMADGLVSSMDTAAQGSSACLL